VINKNYVVIVSAITFILTGCTKDLACENSMLNDNEMLVENAGFSFDYQKENFERTFPNYFISAGDVLDVLFHIKTDIDDVKYQFLLENDNKVVIKFTHTPELNEEQYIRPDGTISLPVLGQVKAAGKTVVELERELRSQYSHVLQNPEIHILVPEFSKRIEELKKDLHTAPRGLSRLVTVRPDGNVTFPMVGDMNVLGKTVPEVSKSLNGNYVKIFRGLHVDLFLEKASGSSIYVLGNVNKAGSYEITRPINILEALALAQGVHKSSMSGGSFGISDSSALDRIIVLRRHEKEKKLVATQVDVASLLEFECGSQMFFLKPYDIVYVPKSDMAEAADMMRDIANITLFRGWSVNLSPIGNVLTSP
jgi:polysaccharide export outer membrane protein